MPGPAPKPARRNRIKKARGEFHAASSVGWQHGPIPDPPDGLIEASREAWQLWFSAWWAAHWVLADLPVLRQTIRLFDEIERGITKKAQDRAQLHTWMRGYGITPDGQLANRWMKPKSEEIEPSPSQRQTRDDPYAHLRVVGE
jgi:hypothetical protein